jgi:hypothetical protein
MDQTHVINLRGLLYVLLFSKVGFLYYTVQSVGTLMHPADERLLTLPSYTIEIFGLATKCAISALKL